MGEKHSTAGLSLLWIHWLSSSGAERTYKYAVCKAVVQFHLMVLVMCRRVAKTFSRHSASNVLSSISCSCLQLYVVFSSGWETGPMRMSSVYC